MMMKNSKFYFKHMWKRFFENSRDKIVCQDEGMAALHLIKPEAQTERLKMECSKAAK